MSNISWFVTVIYRSLISIVLENALLSLFHYSLACNKLLIYLAIYLFIDLFKVNLI